MYTLEDGTFLVKLARKAVTTYLTENREIEPPPETPQHLREKRGVFVTIETFFERFGKKMTQLRGCIGYPEPIMPLVEALIDSAISAAVRDPRFPPMSKEELSKVVFEVSVLTPPTLVKVENPKDYPKAIKVGRDGLIVELGFYKGLLLPQVPVEYGWDEETFLSECCVKAGLSPDCWLSRNVKIYSFQAEVFSEVEPNGAVIRKELRA
ncbi:MAG: TIGR00296 family protein [Candidatus Methanomethylicota archaeon]|uniref:Protein DRJ31_01260 n=1 Tax=Thermoproteota archaeon TaxID=2056631 RepID=A0A497ETX1_9CREN|nr:MAG: TIGR00296 family protein [Candidatus Verstraetearchaeota archaeon]RLE53741.1 MAG: TIGR00296 family protein [Candidatus Verstraetearchaeota archaeon]